MCLRLAVGSIGAIGMAGCTSTNATPVTASAVVISTSAEPMCGRQGAQKVAFNQAAAETLRRGYDKFVIAGMHASSDVRQVGTTPVYASTTTTGQFSGSRLYANSTTNIYGGQPIMGGSHNQDLAVQMYKSSDPQGVNAIDARAQLGPDWEKKIARVQNTCF